MLPPRSGRTRLAHPPARHPRPRGERRFRPNDDEIGTTPAGKVDDRSRFARINRNRVGQVLDPRVAGRNG